MTKGSTSVELDALEEAKSLEFLLLLLICARSGSIAQPLCSIMTSYLMNSKKALLNFLKLG